MRWGVLGGGLIACGLVLAAPGAQARPQDVPELSDVAVAALRQVCDRQWVDGVCEATGYPEPQYRTDADPSPGAPLALRIGVLHEHSGYSDGDPASRPADYFAAGRGGATTRLMPAATPAW